VLQARSALVALRGVARGLRATDPAAADRLDREAERIEAGAVDFARLRAAHLVATDAARVADTDRPELDRLFLAPSAPAALGLPDGTPSDRLLPAALSVIGRWRDLAADPLADPATVEVCETAARTGEAIYGALQPAG
jgi:hypothetical protein